MQPTTTALSVTSILPTIASVTSSSFTHHMSSIVSFPSHMVVVS